MQRKIAYELLENPKLLSHFMEQSYWIKELNRNPKSFSNFQKQMKILYKERASDKLNNALDGIEMISSIIDVSK